MKYLSGFLLLLAFNPASWAGCDEVTSQCLVIDGQEERSESCEIAICANMNEYLVECLARKWRYHFYEAG